MKMIILNLALFLIPCKGNLDHLKIEKKSNGTTINPIDPLTVAGIGFAIGSAVLGYNDSKDKDRRLREIIDKLNLFDSRFDEIDLSIKNLGYNLENFISNNYRNDLRSKLISQINQYHQMAKFDKENAKNILKEIKNYSGQIMVFNEDEYIYYYQILSCVMVIQFDLNTKLKKNNENIKNEVESFYKYYKNIETKLDYLIDKNKPGKISITDYTATITRGNQRLEDIKFRIDIKDSLYYTAVITSNWNYLRYTSNAFDFDYNPKQPLIKGVCVSNFEHYLYNNGKHINRRNSKSGETDLDLEIERMNSCIEDQLNKINEFNTILKQVKEFKSESEKLLKKLL